MTMFAVPYFMGVPMPGLRVPEPHEILTPELPDADPLHRMGVLYKHLADKVAEVEYPTSYSGDCISAIGVLGGLERRHIYPTLIWFDAHGDFNTYETSPSGFPGGMPLAMLTGRGDQTIMRAVGLTPLLDERVILVDGRDLDAGEDTAVADSDIAHTSVEELFTGVPPDGPIHVHLDGDVVNPDEMPAMNYPAAGGPSLLEVSVALKGLVDTGRVVALSVSSWNPSLAGADIAVEATLSLVAPFI